MKYDVKSLKVENVLIRYTLPRTKPTSVFFLGLGQQGKNLSWVADQSPEGMVVVEAIPYTAKNTSEEMIDLGTSVVRAVMRLLPSSFLDIFCESQSAPAVIKAIYKYRIISRSVICIAPIGFNYSELGRSDSQRVRSLLARSFKFWSSPSQHLIDKANAETFKYAILTHTLKPVVTARALRLVANLDIDKEAAEIARLMPVHIFASAQDQLFPHEAIRKQLGDKSAVRLHALSYSGHLNRATSRGMKQLHEVFNELERLRGDEGA